MTKHRILALIATAVAALSGAAVAEEWTPKRLSDGQPDVQGFYRPEIAGDPFAHPAPARRWRPGPGRICEEQDG